jgi:hypothetical protein
MFLRHLAVLVVVLVLTVPARAQEPGATPPDSVSASPPFPSERARGWQTGLVRADRLQHASLSFAIGCGAGLVTERPAAGAAIALSLGVAKELVDDRFDRGDLLADALGAALAAWAIAALTRGGATP